MKLSIIVSTYNRPDALNAVLQGLAQQVGINAKEWEVIIADDGSTVTTQQLIAQWQTHFPCALQHVWHEDTGFRLAAIRNLSAINAQGEYLVFLDGDCIPFPDFAVQTLRLAEPGWFVAGNRVLLSQKYTAQLCQAGGNPAQWSAIAWLWAKLSGKANRALPWLRLALTQSRKKRAQRWAVLKGCNIGVWKQDFIRINGFDESFSGWGHEDSDFAVRLIRAGVLLKDGRFAVPVLHLWHRENDRSKQAENWKKLEETLKSTHIHAVRGYLQYVTEPKK
ncbi:glycosyltransferase family 2 protein [uncultured Deefgea sp.]|uniref:glycosyltransferase family 2 protein n=1 Tax=uncultured Deefgea sp. TaxID=1304914 RepID=UPI0026239D7A|nr:glycosyltransferase family 2 protein [uncultured Deefgea sp.]